jgi:hypothetical protein
MSSGPPGSALYVGLLIVTFAVHMMLIGCVLTGAAYVTVRAVLGRDDALAAASRDWLPFALGAAITAGVAPLLFVQVLYQPRFYTANLLLFVRWLAIVPALIAGFYALYLNKSQWLSSRSRWLRGSVAGFAWLCFVFVGSSWVENHQLSMQRDPATWVAHFRSGAWRYRDAAVAPRLLLWLAVSAPVWSAAMLAVPASARERRRSAWIAIAGLVIAVPAALLAFADRGSAAIVSAAQPWSVVAIVTAATVLGAWLPVVLDRAPQRWLIGIATVALVGAMSVVRELTRVRVIDPEFARRVGHAQGGPLFAVALVIGIGAIGWCVVIARRAVRGI